VAILNCLILTIKTSIPRGHQVHATALSVHLLKRSEGLLHACISSRVRVMFDSGSHKSFVTVDIACMHNLKLLRKEWLSTSTFGRKTTESGLRDVVLIDLIPVSGGGNLTL
jgi:hypothetical protein